jgi:hypothetical protein
MILKDLETVGDKPLKKEMDEPGGSSLSAEMLNNDGGQNSTSGVLQQQICLFSSEISSKIFFLSASQEMCFPMGLFFSKRNYFGFSLGKMDK